MALPGGVTNPKGKRAELELILDAWERRHEWRLLSKTVPRSLIVALLLSLVIGAVGYFRFRLSAEQLALVAAGLCGLSAVLNLLYTLLNPRSPAARARYFDLEFGLQERLSSALELMHGRIKTHPEIEARQIADALAHARAIDPRQRISMDFRRRELAALLVLLLAVLGMILLPSIVGEDFLPEAPSAALEAAQEDLREIIEAVAKDTDLEDVDRQELLEALEIALERLQEEDISQEEAFAAMSQLQEQLEALEKDLADTVELDQSALEAAAEALESFIPPAQTERENADSSNGVQAPEEELLQALQQLAQEASEMSEAETEEASQALQEASQELATLNEELSAGLEAMAEALETGDDEALQQQLDAAAQQLSQEQQERLQQQEAGTMLQEQAEQAGEAAEAIAREQAQEGQPMDSQQGQPQQAEAGQQRSGSQAGDQQASEARQAASQSDRPAQQNRPGTGENPRQSQDSAASGAGAGEGEASNLSLPGSGGEDQGADTNNRSRGEREIQYEALYSPSGIDGGGREEIRLRTDASDNTLAEGDFDDNPLGESRVSYDTVFSEYQKSANRALESDYVPLGLRDVVREYFTSLEPNGG